MNKEKVIETLEQYRQNELKKDNFTDYLLMIEELIHLYNPEIPVTENVKLIKAIIKNYETF